MTRHRFIKLETKNGDVIAVAIDRVLYVGSRLSDGATYILLDKAGDAQPLVLAESFNDVISLLNTGRRR